MVDVCEMCCWVSVVMLLDGWYWVLFFYRLLIIIVMFLMVRFVLVILVDNMIFCLFCGFGVIVVCCIDLFNVL